MENSECVSDEAMQDITVSCPKCGNAVLRLAAKFCDECGFMLQTSKIPEHEEQQTSSDRDFTIANDSSSQEIPMKADSCSHSSQSPDLPEKPSSNGVAENVADDKVIESANKVDSIPSSKQSACEVISSNETTSNVADSSANEVTKKDDSSPTSRQDVGYTKELQIHFHALLDPAFGSSEHMCIILGPPIGSWADGPFINLECVGKCEGYEILRGTLYLPASYKMPCLQAPYKYVKILNGVRYEFISRPKIDNRQQGLLYRSLIIRSNHWKGRYDKFDSIVSPSAETLNPLKTAYQYVTKSIAEKSDIEEFTLCLRAFLPKYNFCSWCMEDVIECCITVVERLLNMRFTASGYHWKRFPEFSNSEKKKIFTSIFRQNIEENHKLLEKGDQNELPNVLLSSITFACILVYVCGQAIPWKECLKLIETFSLVRLRNSGATLKAIAELLSKHVHNYLRIGNILIILLKETLEQDSVRKATTAWWGMLALISILNDMTGEELEFEYVMALLPRILLGKKEVDIVEVETALYYAPKLEQIILSKFDLKNHELILKIEGLDPVALLHRVKLTINRRHLTSSEVKALEELLLLLKSKIEGIEASAIERYNHVTICLFR